MNYGREQVPAADSEGAADESVSTTHTETNTEITTEEHTPVGNANNADAEATDDDD